MTCRGPLQPRLSSVRSDASPLLDELWMRGRDDSSSELSAYGLTTSRVDYSVVASEPE